MAFFMLQNRQVRSLVPLRAVLRVEILCLRFGKKVGFMAKRGRNRLFHDVNFNSQGHSHIQHVKLCVVSKFQLHSLRSGAPAVCRMLQAGRICRDCALAQSALSAHKDMLRSQKTFKCT